MLFLISKVGPIVVDPFETESPEIVFDPVDPVDPEDPVETEDPEFFVA